MIEAECFTADAPRLLASLQEVDCLARYREGVEADLPQVIERPLRTFLLEQLRCLDLIAAVGFDEAVVEDRCGVDHLLTDMVAVGTWASWSLPMTPLGVHSCDVSDMHCGLLDTGFHAQGAALYHDGAGRFVLHRQRSPSTADTIDPHSTD